MDINIPIPSIPPINNLRILRGVPLTPEYNDTLYFSNVGAQTSTMGSFVKPGLNYNSSGYIVENDVIRVDVPKDSLIDCNYLMFKNNNFGLDKWFYHFIRRVDYVDPNCSNIVIERDVMQTWRFDWKLNQCFVEREHSATDYPGDNTIEEGLELGELELGNYSFTGLNVETDKTIVIAATVDQNNNPVTGSMRSGIYSGVGLFAFAGSAAANAFIDGLTANNKVNSIVSIFMMPTAFYNENDGAPPRSYQITKPKNVTSLGSYIPRNKKLLTYPYNFLYVTNGNNYIEFHYELFSGNTCEFNCVGDCTPDPSILLYPVRYRSPGFNFDDTLELKGFPQCTYNIDSYKAFLAQNSSSIGIQTGFQVAQIAGGVATGNPLLVASGISGITGNLTQLSNKSREGRAAKGSVNTDIRFSNNLFDFMFIPMYLQEEYARIIDEYFDVAGYATNRVKIPNIYLRPYWNYVKTTNSNVTGNIGQSDLEKINSIFNKGITFWKDTQVGNYNRDNSPS